MGFLLRCLSQLQLIINFVVVYLILDAPTGLLTTMKSRTRLTALTLTALVPNQGSVHRGTSLFRNCFYLLFQHNY